MKDMHFHDTSNKHLGCVPVGTSNGCPQDVEHGGCPWPARKSIRRSLARRRALNARIWTTFHMSGSDFGQGIDVQGPDAIHRIASGPRESTPWSKSELEQRNAV